MTPQPDPEVERPQVTLKTVFTVCFGVMAVMAIVAATLRAIVVVVLIGASLLIAVALDHAVTFLQRRGATRKLAITAVISGVLLLLLAIAFLLIPPAVEQAKALVDRVPELIVKLKHSHAVWVFGQRTGLTDWINRPERRLLEFMRDSASPLLSAIGSLLNFIGGAVAIVFLTIFMLVFGGPLIRDGLAEARPERRAMYARLLGKIYSSLGGYLGGILLICSINATMTIIFLAINGVPFFLPLGIVSGFSSLVPYAGPAVVGLVISLLSSIGGIWHGVTSAIYFVVYGQLEGNVIGPLILKHMVHVNPLVVLVSVLFFGELAGIPGAIAAVPAIAIMQIVLRELLRLRKEQLQLQRMANGNPASGMDLAPFEPK